MLYDHFREHGCSTLKESIVIHILDDSNENVDYQIRTDKELFWTKLLNTAYPFGLNDKIKNYGIISANKNKNEKLLPYSAIKIIPPRKNRGLRKKKKEKKP